MSGSLGRGCGQVRAEACHGVDEGQAGSRVQPAVGGGRGQEGVDGDPLRAGAEGERNQLQVLVALAGAGDVARVVEAQAVDLGQAGPESLEIVEVERIFLLLELARHDEHVLGDGVELVEKAYVRVRDPGYEEILLVGEKGIGLGRTLLGVGLPFAFEIRCDANYEGQPSLLHHLALGGEGVERPAASRVGGAREHRLPQSSPSLRASLPPALLGHVPILPHTEPEAP